MPCGIALACPKQRHAHIHEEIMGPGGNVESMLREAQGIERGQLHALIRCSTGARECPQIPDSRNLIPEWTAMRQLMSCGVVLALLEAGHA